MRTTRTLKVLATALAAAGITALSGPAMAGSATDSAAPFSVAIQHDFSIVIPGFLYFRVGPGNPFGGADSAAIGLITFTATVANAGDGSSIAGTGGDAAASAATVAVRANRGQVTITETNNSGGNGLGTGVPADGYIAYTEISTTPSNASLPAPALSNAGGGTSAPTLGRDVGVGGPRVTDRSGTWTYAYSNNTLPSAGTYGAGGGTGGSVTYTATTP
ncbi:MAG: hypothetical protein FIB05_02400 [Betaproteobacteria bacterium]|nr:hypothetical protein [Betaproteobacteria bacterium]